MQDTFFVKANSSHYRDALQKERLGLDTLRSAISSHDIKELLVPVVFDVSEESLVLERIISTRPKSSHMERFALGLAKLHRHEISNQYGLETDNYIGLNPQANTPTSDWGEFFIEYRLKFQIQLIKNEKIKREFSQILTRIENMLSDYLRANCEQPSLCHGDLWSGNVLFSENRCYLIDPAIYYGDREVDIAMTKMFGGFSSSFYQTYDAAFPLSIEYAQKEKIYNLYHYLNHYNLFGESYLSACSRIFLDLERKFTK